MLIELEPVKTYASKENVIKAVNKVVPETLNLRYFIHQKENRYFPVFIGQECLQYGIHFKFNVVG